MHHCDFEIFAFFFISLRHIQIIQLDNETKFNMVVISLLYPGQVYWTDQGSWPLPEAIITRFKDKVMAITGYEYDQVLNLFHLIFFAKTLYPPSTFDPTPVRHSSPILSLITIHLRLWYNQLANLASTPLRMFRSLSTGLITTITVAILMAPRQNYNVLILLK